MVSPVHSAPHRAECSNSSSETGNEDPVLTVGVAVVGFVVWISQSSLSPCRTGPAVHHPEHMYSLACEINLSCIPRLSGHRLADHSDQSFVENVPSEPFLIENVRYFALSFSEPLQRSCVTVFVVRLSGELHCEEYVPITEEDTLRLLEAHFVRLHAYGRSHKASL